MPSGAKMLGSGHLMLSPYVGYSFRMLGGDLGATDRMRTIGAETKYLSGAEVGLSVQFGNIVFDPKLTFLSNGPDPDLDGLTGLQFQIHVSFVLPWTVLGGEESESQKKAKEAEITANAERQKADDARRAAEQQTRRLEKQNDALLEDLRVLR